MNRRGLVALLPFVAGASMVVGGSFVCLQFDSSNSDALAAAIYLLTIVAISIRYGLASGLFAAGCACVAWLYYFVPPAYSFAIESNDIMPMFVFVTVAGGSAVLSSALQRHVKQIEEHEKELSALYGLMVDILAHPRLDETLAILKLNVTRLCEGVDCTFWVEGSAMPDGVTFDRTDLLAAHRSGETVDRLSEVSNAVLYLPLRVENEGLGVMVIEPRPPDIQRIRERFPMLSSVASHAALAIQRSRLEQAAGAALGKLEAERLKSSLLASVSHDLRTPLSSIKAAASGILGDDVYPVQGRHHALLESVVKNADRLDRLVGNLLSMSRLESGAWQPVRDFFPFSEVLATVLSRLSDAEAARVHVDMPADLPLVSIDGQQIEQVLYNLLENALKYVPSAKHRNDALVLTVRVADRQLTVRLRDHGNGISPGEEKRIFEKFYRAHRGGERSVPGVGMGLAICKEIVEAHGGRIRAQNSKDGGAEFVFTLPTTDMSPLSAKDSTAAARD